MFYILLGTCLLSNSDKAPVKRNEYIFLLSVTFLANLGRFEMLIRVMLSNQHLKETCLLYLEHFTQKQITCFIFVCVIKGQLREKYGKPFKTILERREESCNEVKIAS